MDPLSRDFSGVRRLVIKVGTRTLSSGDTLDHAYIADLSTQIAALMKKNIRVVLVSSGAIGLGKTILSLSGKLTTIPLRQACAAIGQPFLMHEYTKALEAYNITPAQLLVNRPLFDERKSFVNLGNSIETLFQFPSILPVFNENDTVSTEEIAESFGDNDILSALIASKINADLLLILTDIDSMYTKDPRFHEDSQPLSYVDTDVHSGEYLAGPSSSEEGRGGMKSKVEAAMVAGRAGCPTVLALGKRPKVISDVLAGAPIGTLFTSSFRLNSRKRWILQAQPRGQIIVDKGAEEAIRLKKSLLIRGISAVHGHFGTNSVVQINTIAKIVSSLSSDELRSVLGKHSSETARKFGNNRKLIARPGDIVFIDKL